MKQPFLLSKTDCHNPRKFCIFAVQISYEHEVPSRPIEIKWRSPHG